MEANPSGCEGTALIHQEDAARKKICLSQSIFLGHADDLNGLFFAVEIIQVLGANQSPLRIANNPLFAVGIISELA
jgi:hypothetical protein